MMNSSVDFLVFSNFAIKITERARKSRILYFVLSTFASISAIQTIFRVLSVSDNGNRGL